jgi:hypothetical protein
MGLGGPDFKKSKKIWYLQVPETLEINHELTYYLDTYFANFQEKRI